MKDAKSLEQQAREHVDRAEKMAQALLDEHSVKGDVNDMVVLTMALFFAAVAAGRSVQVGDERLQAIFNNALLRVKANIIDMGKAADA